MMNDDKQYVYVRVGIEEIELLGLLMEDEQFVPNLRDGGYSRSILKLEAVSFIHTCEEWAKITDIGQSWFNINVRVLDKNIGDSDE